MNAILVVTVDLWSPKWIPSDLDKGHVGYFLFSMASGAAAAYTDHIHSILDTYHWMHRGGQAMLNEPLDRDNTDFYSY